MSRWVAVLSDREARNLLLELRDSADEEALRPRLDRYGEPMLGWLLEQAVRGLKDAGWEPPDERELSFGETLAGSRAR